MNKTLIQGHLITLLSLFFIACCASRHSVDCEKKFVESREIVSMMGFPEEVDARQTVVRYISKSVCQGKFPDDEMFQPYFFSIEDMDTKFKFEKYSPGFLKTPASMKVKFENGLPLLFCFNMMIINCDKAASCQCPYDFNRKPTIKNVNPQK